MSWKSNTIRSKGDKSILSGQGPGNDGKDPSRTRWSKCSTGTYKIWFPRSVKLTWVNVQDMHKLEYPPS